MSFEGPLTLQCSVGQADLAVGGDVRPFVLGQKGVIANVCSSPGGSAASDLREDVLVTAVRMLEARPVPVAFRCLLGLPSSRRPIL